MATTIAVSTKHPEYVRLAPRWQEVDHVVDSTVKEAGELYLPMPGKAPTPQGLSDKALIAWQNQYAGSIERYNQYLKRALFYNFTKRTLDAVLGGIYRKAPSIELPSALQYLLTNADGAGVTLVQQSKDATEWLYRHGRCGLLVDMPPANGAVSVADNLSGKQVPRIAAYSAHDIINWHTRRVGSGVITDMVVLRESYERQEDAFTFQVHYQYRVLRLDAAGLYVQEVYRDEALVESFEPLEAGKRMPFIPFFWGGARNNDFTPDESPIYDLAQVNLGHYRNSADLEESSFILSQPTPVVAPGKGMSGQQWNEANPLGIKVGANYGVNVGEGGNMFLLQADANNLARELMKDKEAQAIMLGAQLITTASNQTAEAARYQASADSSVMATIAENTSAMYAAALRQCARFVGANPDEVVFALSKEFYMQQMTAQDAQQWMAAVMAGLLPATLFYQAARRGGWVPEQWTDEDIQNQLEVEGRTDLSSGITGAAE